MRLDSVRFLDVGLRLCFSAVAGGASLFGCGDNPLDVAELQDLVVAEHHWAEH
ncbi:MAG TPA: hypothetical protein VK845_12090 [Gemmatimonadales bacterium]|nr:hypothetical protein [Gemmatimonadales bacterium]